MKIISPPFFSSLALSIGLSLGFNHLTHAQSSLTTSAQTDTSSTQCTPAKTGNPCLSPASAPQINIGAGNPIHLVTGNKFQQENDLYMRASGLEIVRYYNSTSTAASEWGAGWRGSYSTRLYKMGERWQILTDDGRRIMFHAPKQGIEQDGVLKQQELGDQSSAPIAQAVEPAYGQLIWTQDRTWVWVTSDSVVRTFNAEGYLIHQLIPAYQAVYIERLAATGPQATIITRVRGGDESLLYHYEDIENQARLVRIDSPLGVFSYQHDKPSGYSHYRLSKVIRSDQWQRLYHYEAEHQGNAEPTQRTPKTQVELDSVSTIIQDLTTPQPPNPYLLTGISLSTPEQKNLRVNTWAYDTQGRAIYSSVGLQGEDELYLNYIHSPDTVNTKGLTQVRDKAGNLTEIYTTQKAGQYLVEKVTGYGCYLCPAVGTEASYDSAGRMISINGHQIKRDIDGQVEQIIVPHPSWGPLTLDYDKDHRVKAWHSPATGKETIDYNDKGQIERRILTNGTSYRYTYWDTGEIKRKLAKRKYQKSDRIRLRKKDTFMGGGISSGNSSYHFQRQNKDYPYLHYSTSQRVNHNITYNQTYIVTPRSAYEVNYQLPEFGDITRHYYPDRAVKSIQYTPLQEKQKTLVEVQDSLIKYGNDLELSQHNLLPNLSLWLLKNKSETLWYQLVMQDHEGRVLSEAYTIPKQKVQEHSNYLYDKQSRLVAAQAEISSPSKNDKHEYYYAWNNDGSSLAYSHNDLTSKPSIQRDASGLPTQIANRTLRYNYHNRIESVEENGGSIADYSYDVTGRRNAKNFNDKRILYFYLGNKLVGEWTTDKANEIKYQNSRTPVTFNANIHRRYIYAGDLAIAFIDYPVGSTAWKQGSYNMPLPVNKNDYTLFYIHNNHIGQPIMVTDQQQNIRWLARYSPTGEAEILQADIEFNLRSPGQYFDAETGWHDNYYRSYDPRAGHYLEPDPLGPLSINDPFGYAAQQPRRFIDPQGLLLFAFDGTTNKESSNTNVLKMFRLYDDEKYYIEGPGALSEESFRDVWTGALFNSTAAKIIEQQKQNFLKKIGQTATHYDETIPIDILGFSRGAMLGMSFANFIKEHTNKGYFSYQEPQIDKTKSTWPAHIVTHTACIDMRFIGLFDTVSQTGPMGIANGTLDYTASDEWGLIAHAVALNEYRSLFPLTTYQNSQYVVEQPFIGNHSDLGGVLIQGDKTDKDNPHPDKLYGDLGNIPLAWIYTQAQSIGVPLKELHTVAAIEGSALDKVMNPVMHNTYGDFETVVIQDRDIQNPSTNVRLMVQHDNEKLGVVERRSHAQEADLKHYSRFASGLHPFYVGIYGLIDATEYLDWLGDTIGWTAPLEVVPFQPTK